MPRCQLLGLVSLLLLPALMVTAANPPDLSVLREDNLVAWCIVPFDAAKRGPAERAQMLKELGINRSAYDWREEHVPTFEQEILEYKKHGIEFFAFWATHEAALKLFEKHDLHPQIWQMIGGANGETDAEKVANAVKAMTPLAERTKALGCPLSLYNHGGWTGEPQNMVAVCEGLRAAGFDHVGIVYNFHHGHDHIAAWPAHWKRMQPYLHCLNINGMNPAAQPKILGLGQGQHEVEMLRTVIDSGYQGPIGIIDHREHLDAKDSLQENLDGLNWVRKELVQPGSGGPRPQPVAAYVPPAKPNPQPLAAGKFGQALAPEQGGAFLAERAEYRQPPLTFECWAKLPDANSYHILAANELKSSATHWELFTMPGSGALTAYLPGSMPDHVNSSVKITDDKWHYLAIQYEAERVRLLVDAQVVADQPVQFKKGQTVPGPFAIGSLVDRAIGCRGLIDEARISKGIREIKSIPTTPFEADDQTLGLWHFDQLNDQKRHPDASVSKAHALAEGDVKKKSSPHKLKTISAKGPSASNGPKTTRVMTAGS